IVMSSHEASSGVTYTSISSDYKEPSNAGSPGVIVYGYDGLPMHPVDPYEEAACNTLIKSQRSGIPLWGATS
ncbi:hypothetical protein Tco_1342109, partial [Tanacetum coccineum]